MGVSEGIDCTARFPPLRGLNIVANSKSPPAGATYFRTALEPLPALVADLT